MILLIDIGNTTVSVYEVKSKTNDVVRHYRFPTKAELDYVMLFQEQKGKEPPKDCVVCSVVPTVTDAVCDAIQLIYEIKPWTIGRDDIPMPVTVSEPDKVGMDRLMDAYFAYKNVKLPAVTVDLGTATTFGLVTAEDGFLGGSISAGVMTSLQAISNKGAQLFSVDLSRPTSAIGKNTAECLNIGAVCGAAAMVDGMINLIENEIKSEVSLVITGGYAEYLESFIQHPHIVEPDMLEKSMWLLYKKDGVS